MKTIVVLMAAAIVSVASAPAYAQVRPSLEPGTSAASALRDSRYQIGLMEGILQRAAEHGAKNTRDRVRAVVPGDMLLSDDVRVRGFSLERYGVFFDIDMPDLEETLPWIFRTLDQNDLGLDSALRSLRALAEASGNANDRQALQRIEMQLAPMVSPGGGLAGAPALTRAQSPGTPGTLGTLGTLTGSASAASVDRTAATPVDPIVNDPQGVYRAEVTEALIEAMLDYSIGLRLAPTDWLIVAVRGREGMPRLSPADTESPTIQISVRGEDLIALLARQISREDARKRVLIKVL